MCKTSGRREVCDTSASRIMYSSRLASGGRHQDLQLQKEGHCSTTIETLGTNLAGASDPLQVLLPATLRASLLVSPRDLIETLLLVSLLV